MKHDLYSKFKHDELIIRDLLALDRTILANKRTLLSYFRTSLTLFISGFSAWHFIQTPYVQLMGIIFVLLSLVCLTWGLIDYFKYKNIYRRLIP